MVRLIWLIWQREGGGSYIRFEFPNRTGAMCPFVGHQLIIMLRGIDEH